MQQERDNLFFENKTREFTDILFNSISKINDPIFDRHSKKLGANLKNYIFFKETPQPIKKKLSKKDQFITSIFQEFNEIHKSFEKLLDIEVYISRYPYKNTRISRIRHLAFVIESYLEEMYVMKNRLLRFLGVIKREYKSNRRILKIKKEFKILERTINNSLEDICNIRADHVHEKRFQEEDLDRLDTLELFRTQFASKNEEDARRIFEGFANREYSEIREKWKNNIRKNNDGLKKLIDDYFSVLKKILFTRYGNIRVP